MGCRKGGTPNVEHSMSNSQGWESGVAFSVYAGVGRGEVMTEVGSGLGGAVSAGTGGNRRHGLGRGLRPGRSRHCWGDSL